MPLVTLCPKQVKRATKAFSLEMDDSVYVITTLALQKDSEFLQIFNHYFLKALEAGEFKRLKRNYFLDLYTNEKFDMIEPQPLGSNNVMFCFICLGLGICLSLISVMIVFLKMKI